MIANFFNNAKPINSVFLLAALILFYFLAHFNIDFIPFSIDFWSIKIGGLLLLIGLFFIYNFIISKNNLTLSNSYSLLFISLSIGLFYPVLSQFKILLSLVIIGFSFRRIYSFRTNQNVKEKNFDSALWIALASMVYFENLYFLLLIYIGLMVFQRNYWNYFFIPIVGFLVPYFLIYVYALTFNDFTFFNTLVSNRFTFNTGIFNHTHLLFYISIITLVGVAAFIINTIKTSEFSIEFRALWSLVLAHFILAIFYLFTGETFNISKTVFLIFPFGIIMANYMQTVSKKWIKEIVVYLFIGLVISRFIYNFVP
ncbi:MAG: hypothetical protein HQ471_09830 [Flavobacteriales bacterium]|jgi:hypothetical protein|nr:hypothetical protein [Flavobacteriales bacterium]